MIAASVMKPHVLVLLLLTPVLAGCLGSGEGTKGPGTTDDASLGFDPCAHPWPCADGSEWPTDLTGPFEVGHRGPLAIEMSDGVVLRGELVLPDVEPETGLPTVLVMTPYMTVYQVEGPPGPTDGILSDTRDAPVRALVESGYAVAYVAVRGTWSSGGCFDRFTDRTQADVVEVIAHFADQTWSNGRIAMTGVSWPTTSAWEAVHAQAPQLKTIATAANVEGPYTYLMTPQGLSITPVEGVAYGLGIEAAPWLSQDPNVAGDPLPPDALAGQVRPCEPGKEADMVEWFAGDRRGLAEDARIPEVMDGQAAVLMLQGLHDPRRWEDEGFWDDYAGPKGQMNGPWGHEMPDESHELGWPAPLIEWLDFWLKGLDRPWLLGTAWFTVDGQENFTSPGWPPDQTEHQALYLTPGSLEAGPGELEEVLAAPASALTGKYVEVQTDGSPVPVPDVASPLCEAGQSPYAAVHWSQPLVEDVLLAGDAWAYLDLEATTGRGGFVVQLYAADEEFTCAAGTAQGAREISSGGADLSFLEGAVQPSPPDPGTRTHLRVDLDSMIERLEAGDRLALVIMAGDPAYGDWSGRDQAGTAITILGDGSNATSHVVLPVFEGDLAGTDPLAEYPPRPYSRAWFEAGGTIGGGASGTLDVLHEQEVGGS